MKDKANRPPTAACDRRSAPRSVNRCSPCAAWIGVVMLLAASRGRADEPEFYPHDGDRVVFFGDSITQAGNYVQDVEFFLLTRFPDRQFTIINHGISSETVSGTSEPDHDPPRPDAHRRFQRDVAEWHPTVVVACFGMNDGNYHPFEPARFQKYQDGVERLVERVRKETGARIVLLSPPPYDAYRRTTIDPKAKFFGYKFASLDYDQTLARYSEWLLTRRETDVEVVDLHSAIQEHVARRREQLVSFSVSPDAVHPDVTGHWLMAQTLLLAWNAPATCARARIDAAKLRVEEGEVNDLRREGDALEWTWTSPLPFTFDPQCDPDSLALEQVSARLNEYQLTVGGLAAGDYELLAEGRAVGTFSEQQLSAGLDLTTCSRFPTLLASHEVRLRAQERQKRIYAAWRKRISTPPADDAARAQARAEDESEADEWNAIREACRPRQVKLRLQPANGK